MSKLTTTFTLTLVIAVLGSASSALAHGSPQLHVHPEHGLGPLVVAAVAALGLVKLLRRTA